jgi:hypothetical protein
MSSDQGGFVCIDGNCTPISVALTETVRVITRPITVERIQSLLLPQLYANVYDWNRECEQLCRDFEVHIRNPRHSVLDASEWIGVRPELRKETGAWESSVEEWPRWTKISPLWAWLGMVKVNVELADNNRNNNNHRNHNRNVSDFFHILMQCGCNKQSVLTVLNENGNSLLDVSIMLYLPHAIDLLLAEPGLILPPIDCMKNGCSLCWSLFKGLDSQSVVLWQRMSDPFKLTVPKSGIINLNGSLIRHFLYSMEGRTPQSFAMILAAIHNRMREEDETEKKEKKEKKDENDTQVSLRQRICEDFLDQRGWRWHALAMAAVCPDRLAWHLLMQRENAEASALRQILLNDASNASGIKINPLSAALAYGRADSDERAAWLVHRLSVDAINRYDRTGYTPLLLAVRQSKPLTLAALLARVPDVDLTARPVTKEKGTVEISADALCRPETSFSPLGVEALLPDPLPLSMKLVSDELNKKVKWIESRSAERAVLIQEILFDDAIFPRVVFQLCYAYTGVHSLRPVSST